MSEASELFLRNLTLIDETIAMVCRKSGMKADQIEDFAQIAKLRLIENDYAVIARFQKRSSFRTFIAAVVMRILLDHRNHEWGKWRPSAEAERLGEIAVALERMLYRDGLTRDEAIETAARAHPGVSHEQLESLIVAIPIRLRRRFVDLEEASLSVTSPPSTDPGGAEMARRISDVIRGVIDGMPEDDQLLLRLRFESDMTVAQISRALRRPQAPLYRRLYAIMDMLKDTLEAAGITAADVAELIGKDTGILDFSLKNRGPRPSEQDGSTVADREEDS